MKPGSVFIAIYADDTAAIEAALALPIDWERVKVVRMASVEEAVAFLRQGLR